MKTNLTAVEKTAADAARTLEQARRTVGELGLYIAADDRLPVTVLTQVEHHIADALSCLFSLEMHARMTLKDGGA